ncbi:MAG: phosphatase PAP2 family protein [Candidatus Heimdallarchaeota archaeon]
MSPDFDLFFKLITLFGETAVLIAVVASLYWAVSKRGAIGLALVLAIGGYINTFLKGMVGLERPFQSHAQEVKEIGSADSYSFPSGHSEVTSAFWTYSSLKAKDSPSLSQAARFSIYFAGLILVILVPLSRVYLGVHWPGDILVGVIEGFLVAIALYWVMPRVWPFLEQLSDRDQIIFVVIVTLLMASSSTVMTSVLGNDVIVAANWELPGALAGFVIGLILEMRHIGLEVPSNDQKRKAALRLIIGLLLLVTFYYGLKIIASPFEEIELLSGAPETSLIFPLDYLRLFIVGFVAAFGIPWVFVLIESKLEMDVRTSY